MSKQNWSDILGRVFSHFERTDAIEIGAFWDQLETRTPIFSEARRLFDERLPTDLRGEFFTVLRELTRRDLDPQTRRRYYELLASYYDCVFRFEEERIVGGDNIDPRNK